MNEDGSLVLPDLPILVPQATLAAQNYTPFLIMLGIVAVIYVTTRKK